MPQSSNRTSPALTKLNPAAAKALTISLSFFLPIFMLYILEPNSFQSAWKGRGPYIFFLFLFFLELLKDWRKFQKKTRNPLKRTKTLAVAATMVAPTIYVIMVFMFGLNRKIIEVGKLFGIQRYGELFLENFWPLSLEYIFLTVFFAASIQLMYGTNGSKRFAASLCFLGATGSFYMIDTFYPYGTLTTLQSFVPFTISSATSVLDWMSYKTLLRPGPQGAVHLIIGGPTGGADWHFYWPSAGIHSVLIYTLVILLFIKDFPFSFPRKTIYSSVPRKFKLIAKNKAISSLLEHEKIRAVVMYAEIFFINFLRMMPLYAIITIGAAGTFIANVLRIVYISTIGSKIGTEQTTELFHGYYGELCFMSWTITYLLILFLLTRKIGQDSAKNK